MFGRWKKKIEPSFDAPASNDMSWCFDESWSFDKLTADERAERLAQWPREAHDALDQARYLIGSGLVTLADACISMRVTYEELAPDGATLDTLTERAWSERLAQQQSWTGEADYPKVVRAFQALADQAILARMNFACCQTCGHQQIGDDVADIDNWRGYAFFHEQDAERLGEEPCTLYLAYGTFDDSVVTDAAVATEVAQALRDQGLQVEWDGTTTARVGVVNLRWRKPLPTD